MDSASKLKTNGGSRLFVTIVVVELCFLTTGVQCLEWHLKPPMVTSAESGKNVTISWGYTLESEEKLITLKIYLSYLDKVGKPSDIAILTPKAKHIKTEYNKKARIIYRNSTVSLVIFTVTKKKYPQKYCANLHYSKINGFQNKESCTELLVYERPRIMPFRATNIIKPNGTILELRCNASGDPNPSVVWTKITPEKTFVYLTNSSMRKYELTVNSETLGNYCCIATNNYGNDTACINVSIGVSTPCNKTTSEPRDQGQDLFTTTALVTTTQSLQNLRLDDSKVDIAVVVIIIVCIIVVILVGASIFICKARKKSKKPNLQGADSCENESHKQQQQSQVTEENPYGEPIDAIISPSKTSMSNEYASAEEVGITRKEGENACDGDNIYAQVMNSRSTKKPFIRTGKNKAQEPSQISLVPLYEETPGQKGAIV